MMTSNDLVSVIKSHRRDSLGYQDGGLSHERAKAMDHYHGRPYGNEVEGRSAVVSKDLSEAVDWAMPAIMRVFCQSGNIAEFEPVTPDDEAQAQQESDVVNKVVMQDNNGFMVLHDAIKDALLLKNGYLKHSWDTVEEISHETYTGLTMQEVAMLMDELERDGAEVEIEGQEEKQIFMPQPDPMTGQVAEVPVQVFDVKLKITRREGKVSICAVPPEELRISKKCRGSLDEADFVEHVTRKTRSDLIAMGMARDFVDTLPAFNEEDNNTEVLARDSVDDESDNHDGMAFIDRSMDEIEYCEAYIRVDWDDDGIAELRKVVTVADRIPPGDEWNEPIEAMPITGGSPKRVPHRHVGESLDDDIADLQEIKTTLLRQMLDNIYLTNNNQWLVNERVNLSDFLQSTPGGIKRVRGMEPIAGSVEPVMATPIMGQIMPAIDYVDNIKESRTGINRATTGLDPDVLKQSTKGAFMENLNRASQKIEMITRMLAETLVKPAMLHVHGLLIRHQDKPMITKLRGQFVQVNPQEWRHRRDMRIKVGLGTGSEEEKREKLLLVAQMQANILGPQGMIGPMQAYNLFSDTVKAMGFDMPDKYAMSPQSPEFQQKMSQPPMNPMLQVEQMKLQADQQKAQAQMQMDQQKMQMQAQIEQQKAQANLQQEQLRSQNDVAIEERKITAQMELARYEADLKAQTELQKAQMELEAKKQIALMEAEIDAKLTLQQHTQELGGLVEKAKGSQGQDQSNIIMQGLQAMIQSLNAPKMIIRDESGRAAGVQVAQ